MARNYYGGAPTAFQGGQVFGAERRKRQLEENALNALIEQYGPTAADAATASTLQGMEQRADLHPYDVSDAQRVDAARRAAVDTQGVIAGDPAAQKRGFDIEDRANAQRLDAGRRAAAVLQLVKARKGNLSKAFDMVQHILPDFGIPADRMAEAREAIVNDPDAVDELVAMLSDPDAARRGGSMSAPRSVYNRETKQFEMIQQMPDGSWKNMPGLASSEAVLGARRADQGEERIGIARNRLTHDQAKARGFDAPEGYEIWEDEEGIHAAPLIGSKQEQESQAKIQEADQSDKTFLRSATLVRRRARIVRENAQEAIKYFSGADGGVLLQNLRRGAPLVAGTDMFEANQALDNIRGNVALSTLEEMRKSSKTGASGMGSLTAPELELLKNAVGGLTQIRDPQILVRTLQDIIEDFDAIESYAENDANAAQQRLSKRGAKYPGQSVSRSPRVAPDAEPTDEELMQLYGGAPPP